MSEDKDIVINSINNTIFEMLMRCLSENMKKLNEHNNSDSDIDTLARVNECSAKYYRAIVDTYENMRNPTVIIREMREESI